MLNDIIKNYTLNRIISVYNYFHNQWDDFLFLLSLFYDDNITYDNDQYKLLNIYNRNTCIYVLQQDIFENNYAFVKLNIKLILWQTFVF